MSRTHAGGAPAPGLLQARLRAPHFFIFSLLAVEFLDELLFGVHEAAWPLMRDDLRLTYAEVGMLMSLPSLFGSLVEPLIGILGDVWRRRTLVLWGGVAFAAAAFGMSASQSFVMLLASAALSNPAGGAFVGLSQAELMDVEPSRREQNMARWTFAGSLGNAVGPLVLAASLWAGAGWRWPFAGVGALLLLMTLVAARLPFPARPPSEGANDDEAGRGVGVNLLSGAREAWRALRRREVRRWLVLLEVGDLTGDVLLGFLALYFVDVAGVSESWAAFAVIVRVVAALPGDFLLVPLLERVRGLSFLRWSTLATLLLLPLFLLAPNPTHKLVLLALLGLTNAGRYAILKAQLYAAVPGRTATVTLTLANVSGLAAGLVPLTLGFVAQRYGLGAMMWLLLAGPLALSAVLWREKVVNSE